MGTTVDSISELRDFAQEMGATTAFSATQSAEALNYMALAGYDAETSMSMLPNVLNLAAAGGMELARASDMITDASSALGLSLDETSELVDKMAMASSKSNTSVAQLGDAILTVGGTAKNLAGGTTELSAALGILADNGIKGAEGGTALRNIILSLSAPTDKAAAKMEELGVAAYDNEGNLRSLNDIFTDLNGALSTMTQGEQTDVLNTLFNKVDLKSANALLANTGDRFNELTGYINDAAGAADDMAKVQLDNLAGDITLFQSALEGAQIAISDSLTPTLREFVQFGSDAVSTLGTAFKEGGLTGAMDALGTILSDGIAMITEKLPEFVEAGMGLLSALGQGLLDNLPMLAQAATEIILNLTQFIIQALPELIQAGFMIISTVAQGLAEALPELIPAIVDVILEIVDVLTQPDNIVLLLDAAIAIVIGLADGIMKSLPKLLERMPEIIVNVVGALIAAIPELIEGVLDLGYAIITGIVDGAMSVMDNLGEIWESVKEAFSGAWDKIKETWAGVGDWFGEKWSDIKSRFAETKEWFSNKFKEAKEAAQKHWEKIGDWFGKRKDEAQRAWNGFDTWMGDHFGKVWEAIKKPFKKFKEFFDGLIQIIKDVFSGNKSLLEVGTDIVNGIWNGIKGAAETFTRNVKEFFGNIVQGVKDFLGIHSPSKLFKEQIGENIALGVAEGIDAKADKAIKAADDLAKDVYSRSKDWADKQTKYMELSLDDQIELWETIQGQFIETSKQYSDAEEKLYDLRKKKRDEEAKEAERQTNEYVANIKSGLDKIKKLWDDYKTVYDKEYSSINGAFGLFASPNDRQYVEGVDLMENMRKQIRDINQFYDGLEQLQERGVGRDMVDEIRAMGPGAINELVGLLDLSDQQLEEYYDMYKHKADVAKYWTDRYTDNLKNIAEASITGMFAGMNVELNDALDAAYDWGEDYVKELAAGIEAGTLSYLNGSGAMIAGRLSGAENWSGDMHITVNAAVGQTVEAVAQEVERRILNAFANRKQVYA